MSLKSGCEVSDNGSTINSTISRQNRIGRSTEEKRYLVKLGDNIRKARKLKGYSQEAFADIAGFSRSYYTEIMVNANPSSQSKLENLTLGQLISEYIDNEAMYVYVVPKKHKPLLQLCNTYRVFSVHPKKDKITGLIASTILSVALSFLTDEDNKAREIEPTEE